MSHTYLESPYNGAIHYAIAMRGTDHSVWIEFYWGDDSAHACEQARDANPEAEIVTVRMVPGKAFTD